jgi:hypothetical protein
MVNNIGSMKNLELWVVVKEALDFLVGEGAGCRNCAEWKVFVSVGYEWGKLDVALELY